MDSLGVKKVKSKKITSKMKFSEILELKGEKGADILANAGMGCVFCPMAQQESLEQGCLAHGLDEKEIEKLLEKLNK
jgi:hybrid cluster-associated redox disulfide protein